MPAQDQGTTAYNNKPKRRKPLSKKNQRRKPATKKPDFRGAHGKTAAGAGASDTTKAPKKKRSLLSRTKRLLSDAVGAGVERASSAPAGGAVAGSPKTLAGAGAPRVSGLTRVVRNTAAATVEAHARDPLKQAGHDLAGARDAVKGIIGVPAAVYTVGKELATEGKSKTGAKLVRDVGKDYARRYGDAYKDTPGAYKRQLKRQRKDGSFPEILDLATLAIPAGEGATVAARTVATAQKRAGKTGTRAQRAVDATRKRAPLRESAGHVAPQKPRRTVTGAAVTVATDKTRKAVQKRAVSRAESGKKKLSERRAAAEPGEVVAISDRLAAKRARKRLAKTTRIERQTAASTVQRELAGRKGGKDSPADRTTRRNTQELPSDAHRDALAYAHQYGVRDAKGAKAILTRRIAQLERERQRAPLTKGELASARDELPTLKALLADPSVFEHPEVRRVADIEVPRSDRLSGPEAGLAPDRHTLAKYQPQADTFGIQRHAKDASTLDYAKRIAPELGLKAPTDAAVHALAREKGITRQAAAHEANARFMREVGKAKAATPDGGASLARRTTEEPANDFAARVQEAAAKHGLVEPGYSPSRSNAVGSAEQRQGVSGQPDPPAGSFAKREGEVFRRGLEGKDPELLVGKLAQTVRQGARLKAESELLHREGKRFDGAQDANEWMEANHVDPDSVTLVNDPVVRKDMAPAVGPDRGDYVPTDATYVVPKAVMKEWDAQHAAPSIIEKGAARLQSNTQAVLLGTSPSWFTFQVLADTIGLSAAGGVHKLLSANKEYRKLSDADRELVDVHIGGSPANDVLIDKSGEQLGRMAAVLATSPTYRKFVQGRRPLTALLRAEGARASAFRRAAFAAKAARIDKSIVASRAPLARVQDAIAKQDKPGDLARALANPKAAEAAAQHVNDIMGNFADYTALERRALKSAIPFYGFLRYSLKTVLYTLPVDHPYVATILAQLGRLSSDEARDIVGPDLPYGLSKFYNADGTKAVDLSRASPVLNSLTASSAVGQLTSGLMPPIAVLVANQAFGKNLFTGRNYKVGGSASPTDGNDLTNEDRVRIFAHELLRFIAPVRAYEKAALPAQSDDTLPFSRRPLRALDADISNSMDDSAADRDKQGALDRFLHEMLPLLTPQQPTQDKAAGANATKKKAERKALRSKREEKRDALENDPLAALKFDAAKEKARLKAQVSEGVDSAYLDELLADAGLKRP